MNGQFIIEEIDDKHVSVSYNFNGGLWAVKTPFAERRPPVIKNDLYAIMNNLGINQYIIGNLFLISFKDNADRDLFILALS